MPYLTAPESQTARKTYRYLVELESLETDFEGVPVRHQMIDCVLTEASKEALNQLIASAGWLEGYKVLSVWVPEDGCDAF